MARPATMFYWRGRGFATDAGGTRTLLAKGPRTKANRELALQRLVQLQRIGTLPSAAAGNSTVAGAPSGNPTLGEVINHFLGDCDVRVQAGELKPSTLSLFYRPYLALIGKVLGDVLVRNLSRATVLQYRTRLAKSGLRHNTVKNHLGVLRTLLRWAKRQGMILGDGVEAIPCLPRRRRGVIPTADELQKLLAAAPPDVRDVLETLLNIAVRPGDLYALKPAWVDLAAGLLRLADSKTGPRLVCLVPRVTEILARRMRSEPAVATGHVFTTANGRPWTIRYFAQKVRDLRRRVGLGPHVCAYALRHYWTTAAFLRGLDLPTVRSLRGDRDPRTTLWYEHVSEHLGHLRRAACQAVGTPLPEAG